MLSISTLGRRPLSPIAIREATPADRLAPAQEAIDPARLAIVVVGSARTIRRELEEIAPVTRVPKPAR